jgi:hypothetical protein
MVSEDAVTALVADVMMLRAARGHDVTVTPENTVWLMRGAVVMLGAFGPARETTEVRDEALHQNPG